MKKWTIINSQCVDHTNIEKKLMTSQLNVFCAGRFNNLNCYIIKNGKLLILIKPVICTYSIKMSKYMKTYKNKNTL